MSTANTWVLASNNHGKIAEFKHLLNGIGLQIKPQAELGVKDAVEDGLSFIENALIKARWASAHTGLPALADDSGLAVDALLGEPGIYSARYAGANATDALNNQKLLQALTGVSSSHRSAQFHCVLAFVRHAKDPTPIICNGIWQGCILEHARGENGFGYDPLFWIPSLQKSSAELTQTEKSQLSHRGQAISQFKQHLSSGMISNNL